jgi:hypothetical protein
MKTKNNPFTFLRTTVATGLLAALATQPAMAERPMAVDDAGTLDRGGAKLDFGWSKYDRVRGWDAAAGYGPIDNVELELAFEMARDHDTSPRTELSGVGFAAKWVPLQQAAGLSAGLKAEIGRARADDQLGNKETAYTRALIGLASWTFEAGQIIHLNLGHEWERIDGDTEGLNVWGLGFDHPLSERVQLTLEVFGTEHGRPDKAVGLRWEIADGLKVSAAAGYGSSRSFANTGVAWEF